MIECFLSNLVAVDSNIAPVSGKDFLDIQAITECGFTLNVYASQQEHIINAPYR